MGATHPFAQGVSRLLRRAKRNPAQAPKEGILTPGKFLLGGRFRAAKQTSACTIAAFQLLNKLLENSLRAFRFRHAVDNEAVISGIGVTGKSTADYPVRCMVTERYHCHVSFPKGRVTKPPNDAEFG